VFWRGSNNIIPLVAWLEEAGVGSSRDVERHDGEFSSIWCEGD
jgi:hypothetical protein